MRRYDRRFCVVYLSGFKKSMRKEPHGFNFLFIEFSLKFIENALVF